MSYCGGGRGEDDGVGNGDDDLSVEEPLTQQLHRCKTTNAVFVSLNTKLRAYKSYGVGDIRLYTGLTEASRYIQGMCEKSLEGQDALRESGVLNSLAEAFLFFYAKHLEDHVNPLNYESLLKCWSNLSTALWEAVDNPVNPRNQDIVSKKLVEKNELKPLIEFVLISFKTVEKQTERYVISLIQLYKALVIENSSVKKLFLSRSGFIPGLVESLRLRLQLSNHEVLMWKSIDLMGWLLSMLLQQDPTLNEDDLSGSSSEMSSSNFDQVLCELVGPSLLFMDVDRISEKQQSVGIIMMLVSLLGRSLTVVQRFIKSNGETILGQIFASPQTDAVVNATKLTFQVLAVQKKRMRESYISENDLRADNDGVSMSSRAYSIGVEKSSSKVQLNDRLDTSKSEIPCPLLCKDQLKGLENARQWVEKCSIRVNQDFESKTSSDSSSIPHAPPPSEVETSISRYRTPSLFSFCATPRFEKDCCCDDYSKPTVKDRPITSPGFYEQTNGSPNKLSGRASFPAPLKKMSYSRSVPDNRYDVEFAPPTKRRRNCNEHSQINSTLDLSTSERSEDNEDRESLISIRIPRKNVKSSRIHDEYAQKDVLEECNIQEQFKKLIGDLRPCDFMETDDHVVVFCTPSPCKMEDKRYYNQQENNRESQFHTKAVATQNSGLFGRFFRWLFA